MGLLPMCRTGFEMNSFVVLGMIETVFGTKRELLLGRKGFLYEYVKLPLSE